jgi:hypothetical protein
VDEPGVEIGLERGDAVVGGFAHLQPEELVEDGAVEPLDEAVRLRSSDPCAAVLDAIEV